MQRETSNETAPGLHLGPRSIPVPTSISPAAQAALAMARPAPTTAPPPGDIPAWKTWIAAVNEATAAALRGAILALPAKVWVETIAGVTVHVAEPPEIPAGNRDKALVYFHGGGLVLLAGECVGLFARSEASATLCRVYSVDFRNPPDHRYPAALEDCAAVYRALLERHRPEQLVVSGASGGGNLAVAVPLKLRDEGVLLPGAIGLFTPELDLTESGDSFRTNEGIDVVLPCGLPELNALYAGGADLAHRYLSPLFGDFSKGWPPTFIQSGTRDLFLSNAVRMHRALRRADVVAELHVGEAMPHGGFGWAPEDFELRLEFRKFLARHAGWAPAVPD